MFIHRGFDTSLSSDGCSQFKGLLLLPLQTMMNEEATLQGDEKEENRKGRIQSCSFEWAPIRLDESKGR